MGAKQSRPGTANYQKRAVPHRATKGNRHPFQPTFHQQTQNSTSIANSPVVKASRSPTDPARWSCTRTAVLAGMDNVELRRAAGSGGPTRDMQGLCEDDRLSVVKIPADIFGRNLAERLPGQMQTNNRAELLAIIRALESCPFPKLPLEIRTDSQYSIACELWCLYIRTS